MTTETKRKRGRPSVFKEGERVFLGGLWSDRVTTRRGLLNKHYEMIAFSVIKQMQREGIEGLEYICDDKQHKVNLGIARALGQYEEDEIREWAIEICKAQQNPETKKTVHEWEWLLREYRLGRLSETVSNNTEDSAL